MGSLVGGRNEFMADRTSNQAAGRYPATIWTQVIDVIQKGDGDLAWAALSEF